MILQLIVIIASISISILSAFTLYKVNEPLQFYRPILILIGAYILLLLLIFIFFMIASLFFNKKKIYNKPNKFSKFLLTNLYKIVLNHSNLKIRVIGKNRIPRNSNFLLVCNHRSNFDPIILGSVLSRFNLAFITKESNFKYPFLSHFMASLCYIPVNRDDPLQSLEQMKRAASLISSKKSSIMVFPEGTRQQELNVKDFHEGVFNIAIRTGCPIVVSSLYDPFEIHKNYPFKRTHINLRFLCVITKDDYQGKTAKEISDMVKEMLNEQIEDENTLD